jgi:hypothetical protein
MHVPPLLGSLTEERDIQKIGLTRIDERGLGLRNSSRNEGMANSDGMNAEIDLGEGSLDASRAWGVRIRRP